MTPYQISSLKSHVQPLRDQLVNHPIYKSVNSVHRLRVFMEHHVFAVWDFMSLLKALQLSHTGLTLPWTPKRDLAIVRLINEIVLGEESDEDGRGGFISHFELYREAMKQIGASTDAIDSLIASLNSNSGLDASLVASGAPKAARDFTISTWSVVASSKPHCIAAAFSLGREDIIPDMFRNFVESLYEEQPGQFERLRYYLIRHIEVDEGSHGPMALKAICQLCGEDNDRWSEATDAACTALLARIKLWDAIVVQMDSDSASYPDSIRSESIRKNVTQQTEMLTT